MKACEVLGLLLGAAGIAWMFLAELRSLQKQAARAKQMRGVDTLAEGSSAIDKLIELLTELAKGLSKRMIPGAFMIVAGMILLLSCK